MQDIWIEDEWHDLCERLRRCAEHQAARDSSLANEMWRQADEFCNQEPPARYPNLLDRVRDAARRAVSWQCGSNDPHSPQEEQDAVDEAGEESFPASDPPAWSTAAV